MLQVLHFEFSALAAMLAELVFHAEEMHLRETAATLDDLTADADRARRATRADRHDMAELYEAELTALLELRAM